VLGFSHGGIVAVYPKEPTCFIADGDNQSLISGVAEKNPLDYREQTGKGM